MPGATTIGAVFKDGVILASEKRVTYGNFIMSKGGKKVFKVTDQIGVACAGLVGDMQILAEPGRFLVANACSVVAKVVGKAFRDGKPSYYINDGVYHTYSGQVFDHTNYPVLPFKAGEKQISAVFGPTCDAFDTITLSAELPELEIGDLVYSENIGAYSHASSTYFNGFPPAKVVHLNQ